MTGYDIERAVVFLLCSVITEKSEYNHSIVSQKAFKNSANPTTRWRSMRNVVSKTSRPAKMSIEDAWNVANALDLDLASIVFKAEQIVKDGWKPPS